MEMIKRFLRDETAMTATEYAMMLALVGICIIVVGFMLWQEMRLVFQDWLAWFQSAATERVPG